jgi:predicted CoA-substrate-specific enzyme activase
MNSLCAAGTGSFLDQQSKRIGVSIDKEFGELSLKSKNPPRIAGRCSVFAKSDMIHLQQIATPVHDIVAGLCFAVARNFKSTLGKGKSITAPVLFQGGVAANIGMIRAFREILNLQEDELIIPKHHASMGAIGASLYYQKNTADYIPFKGIESLEKFINNAEQSKYSNLKPLVRRTYTLNKETRDISKETELVDVFLGIDVGSLSTNVVLIDKNINVIARRYLPTASKPLDAIRRGLSEIGDEIGKKVNVVGVGTTGSGRYLTGDFTGADTIVNEITAQATATIASNPEVDTIFEIGGQDSKYIQIENGVIVDFEMNKVCAAGTGSFLEEQAEKLNINIKEEFEHQGFQGRHPSKLGERCTVFMESDLNSLLQKGDNKENLIAGLAYSTVQNYINRVVRDKPIGKNVFFQGGVTNNKAVVAAFEEITGKKINIPPHFDITGAIGAAILARENMNNGQQTKFKGFNVGKAPYTTDKFICKKCSNQCEIRLIKVEGEKPLFYGGICDIYEMADRKGKGKDIPNLFDERMQMLLKDYTPKVKTTKTTIGIPRGLMLFYQQFPFWKSFFEKLNFDVVISGESDKTILTNSIEMMTAETCLPVELIHGHVNDLLDKNIDYVFLPFVVNNKSDKKDKTSSANCPWVQSNPFMVKAALNKHKNVDKLLIPTLHFKYFDTAFQKEISSFMNDKFGFSKAKIKEAINIANTAQEAFEAAISARGKEVLANLPKNKMSFVILGRPYNTADPMQNLSLVEKLIKMDILPIPQDFMPWQNEDITDAYPNMYWPNGKKILSAARIVNRTENLNAIYLGNFKCGPDTFIQHYVKKEIKNKPYLHLEVDEHSADAGMITRIEAFVDSLKGSFASTQKQALFVDHTQNPTPNLKGRTLYFPYGRDAIYVFAAACKSVGIKAEVLPMQDETDIEIGRKHTNGQECFPMIATTGSFVKKLMEPGLDPKKVAFFMPDHNGPCRFGNYNKLQRIIFNKLGFNDVEILQPSNDDSYASVAPGHSTQWRTLAYKGIIAIDLLRKMQQQKRPYELIKGQTNKVYKECFSSVVESIEKGGKDLVSVMKESARKFKTIAYSNGERKPVVAIVGEIFMRDNPFCSSFLVDRLENLGAETLMAPFGEWLNYSTYRYGRDSKWKKDTKGLMKSKMQGFFQHHFEDQLVRAVSGIFPLEEEIPVKDMLSESNKYIHQDYDGDPPMALGTASILSKKYVSGIVNILPFSCMPGTLNTSVSDVFRQDNNGLPWENFAYDGQEDSSSETRFQAFMYQVKEYSRRKGFNKIAAKC